jgi:hypothetical protein
MAVKQKNCQDAFVYADGTNGEKPVISCARFTPKGKVETISNECCLHNSDMSYTPEWVKYSLSPQFYGMFR